MQTQIRRPQLASGLSDSSFHPKDPLTLPAVSAETRLDPFREDFRFSDLLQNRVPDHLDYPRIATLGAGSIPPQLPHRLFKTLPVAYRNDEVSINHVRNLHKAINSHDLPGAWYTYQTILNTHPLGSRLIPLRSLHSIMALLCKETPPSRQTFLRMVSVTSEIRKLGRTIYRWEWNALIHMAAAGFRYTRIEDYEASLGIVQEMLSEAVVADDVQNRPPEKRVDIVTLNTLLAIAVRTKTANTVKRALNFMTSRPEIQPDRMTYLVLLKHHGMTGRIDAVPRTLGLLLGCPGGLRTDGINSTIWAYAKNGKLKHALYLYRRIRANAPRPRAHSHRDNFNMKQQPDIFSTFSETTPMYHPLFKTKGIDKALAITAPDRTTYILLTQALAYHGDFVHAIAVFRDLISTAKRKRSWPRLLHSKADQYEYHLHSNGPSLELYRALFIGFTRHAALPIPGTLSYARRTDLDAIHDCRAWDFLLPQTRSRTSRKASSFSIEKSFRKPNRPSHPVVSPDVAPESYNAWTAANLSSIFSNFLDLPFPHSMHRNAQHTSLSDPSNRNIEPTPLIPPIIVYWALIAFARTTDGYKPTMLDAWQSMASRFNYAYRDSLPSHNNSPLGASPGQQSGMADDRYRVRGRLKTLVDWIEDNDLDDLAGSGDEASPAAGFDVSTSDPILARMYSRRRRQIDPFR